MTFLQTTRPRRFRELSRTVVAVVVGALLPLAFAAHAAPVDSAAPPSQRTVNPTLNQLAEQYVRLVLALGAHDPDYVDAYYGPAAIRDEVKRQAATPAQIEAAATPLLAEVDRAPSPQFQTRPELVDLRRAYLKKQLGALIARAQMLQGKTFSFDEEARLLYDTEAPHYDESRFAPILARIEALLPKQKGDQARSLSERYNRYVERFAVPKAKLEKVMNLAIEEARVRAYNHMPVPISENFRLSFVTGKPWSAYNWYQGKLQSRIEVNTDLPIPVARVIELASHEGYPGHHVYNTLLENGLVLGQNWPEYTVYPLFSPQSLIAEGTADFGVGLAFPGADKLAFTKELFRAAGLNPKDADRYLKVVAAARELVPAGIEAARRYLDGKATVDETKAWLQKNLLYSPERATQRIAFIDKYRAYIINYTWGEELVRGYVEGNGNKTAGSPEQWQQFFKLISLPRTPSMLSERPTLVADAGAALKAAPADVNDLADFDRFIATQPTIEQFAARYPKVFVVRPGTITTREFRADRSRFFPELNAEGRITGGSFN